MADQRPKDGNEPRETAQGNSNTTSRSNIRKRIPIKKKWILNSERLSPKESKPHSYADSFSESSTLFLDKKNDTPNNRRPKTTQIKKKLRRLKYSLT